MVADFMTIQELKGQDLRGLKIVFVGDARNNVANSLMVSAVKLGMHFTALAPKKLFPEPGLVKKCQAIAQKTAGSVTLTDNLKTGPADADVIYTDVWVSMGESDWDSRLKLLHDYQVDMAMLKRAKKDVIFLHCLPAFHNDQTEVSQQMGKKYGSKYRGLKTAHSKSAMKFLTRLTRTCLSKPKTVFTQLRRLC